MNADDAVWLAHMSGAVLAMIAVAAIMALRSRFAAALVAILAVAAMLAVPLMLARAVEDRPDVVSPSE